LCRFECVMLVVTNVALVASIRHYKVISRLLISILTKTCITEAVSQPM